MSATASAGARRLAAATLAAGALISLVALPASAADHDRHPRLRVTISEVQYDAPGRDDRSNRSLNREWVEITNTTRHGVNLDGWTLRNEDGRTYTFDDYRLRGRTTVRIHTGFGRDTASDLYQRSRHHIWGNRSDTATLRNDRGRFIDSESWGHHRHHDMDDRGDHRHHDMDDRGHHRHHDMDDHGDNRHGDHRHTDNGRHHR
ncbi:lamin tail domain-containing protein [Streptomyces heilongjiangensis]|uniref:Lamin tail domain-containing protein n=1 Tax=Streptomyces heilongjiangensis TaxID=945052 RepID=A0ABW1B2E1_9ACTN|nr:lamin tail domain-containing protein [Streptomyces heilongjiangensis]MDC2950010.1 lamin tail domain-containing protein [Streptomyces heilongjiangensis]